ncbi:MAG: TMEM165/GDT1 family protein [Phormidesmis sp.]
MDFQLLTVSFMTVFISELGDKSQLAAIALGGSSPSPKAVFFGSASALLLASLVGVLLGESTALLLPEKIVKGVAAIGFGLLAVRLLWPAKDQPTEDPLSRDWPSEIWPLEDGPLAVGLSDPISQAD